MPVGEKRVHLSNVGARIEQVVLPHGKKVGWVARGVIRKARRGAARFTFTYISFACALRSLVVRTPLDEVERGMGEEGSGGSFAWVGNLSA